ncbi:MAG: hypothetical protein ACR2QT_15325 [Woeseiaceae bacterium]
MCRIDWTLFAAMLGGIGTLLVGIAAVVVLPKQLGYRKEAKESRTAMKLMLLAYRRYMGGEEGIVWGDYPKDADNIIKGICRDTSLKPEVVRGLLDELKIENRI